LGTQFIRDLLRALNNKDKANDYKQKFNGNDQEESIVSEIIAPMGGKVLDVKVKSGDAINEGDEVVILEAMKMELPVVSEVSGKVKEVKCSKGDTVEAESVLVILE
jgi:acetyl-CoA carboxylase biotin carboxyl carrier protein